MQHTRCNATFLSKAVLIPLLAFFELASVGVDAQSNVPKSRMLRTLPTTHGVNYEFADGETHPDYVSSARLSFLAEARIGSLGSRVQLVSDEIPLLAGSVCTGPCNLRIDPAPLPLTAAGKSPHNYLNCTISGRDATCDLRVVRFGQFGRVESEMPFNWLVVMAENEDLKGMLRTTVNEAGALRYPGAAEMSGRMVVTVQFDGQKEPIRLASRKVPIFRGAMPGWPPHGMILKLANPPIQYFLQDEIDDPTSKPLMTVTSNTVTLGKRVSDFFRVRPEIDVPRPAEGGGLLITWTETASKIAAPKIVRYHVYRNRIRGKLEHWRRIATVPVGTNQYVDREVPTSAATQYQYLVSHAADYPFGYEYEGIFSPPESPSDIPALGIWGLVLLSLGLLVLTWWQLSTTKWRKLS